MEQPRTLQEAIQHFAGFENCKAFMSGLRWPDGVVKCPHCGSDHVVWLANARLWKCYGKHERPKFSLKTGTIFEDSPLGLDKWLAAAWLICNCKNGISSYEIGRDLGISQKSAWHMMHRLRFAFHPGNFNKLSGQIEADETFIGGKDKTAVMGILERGGKVRATVVPNRKKKALQAEIREARSRRVRDLHRCSEVLRGAG
jgi:transposase-like protein